MIQDILAGQCVVHVMAPITLYICITLMTVKGIVLIEHYLSKRSKRAVILKYKNYSLLNVIELSINYIALEPQILLPLEMQRNFNNTK